MAFAFYKYFLNMTFADNGGNTTTRRVEIDGGLLGVELQGNVDIVVNRMVAATDARLTGFTIESTYRNDDQSLPASGVQIEDLALLTLQLDTFGKKATFSVPAPKPAIFVALVGEDANKVDPNDPVVQDIVDMFVAGSGQARLSDGESTLAHDAGGFVRGRRTHRGSTKG
jgi:hypothetical protein